MKYGWISESLVPGRETPSDKAQMTTQLLFGELYSVLESEENWVKIKNRADEYECWIDRKQHTSLKRTDYEELISVPVCYSGDLLGKIKCPNNSFQQVPFGANIFGLQGKFQIGKDAYELIGKCSLQGVDKLIENALLFQNAPYLWGGKSILGIDCSGFVQVVYRSVGINLPRDAYQQKEVGEPVEDLGKTKPGDLAFFANDKGRITHVGILLKGNKIIHASGKVRIDQLNEQGIIHDNSGKLTHRISEIKRVANI